MSDIIQTCRVSGQNFVVTEADQEFYNKIGVPLPALCPVERQRRRLSWRNERTLYVRKCDATGEQIMSIHSQDRPFPVYENDYWWSDKWDPLDYGRDFDFSRPFFEQFNELQDVVPQFALTIVKPTMENADYCNQTGFIKDCYLIFDSRHSERCLYSKSVEDCFDCVDCLKAFDCELCYECNFCLNCYKCTYLFNSQNCNNCHFSSNLIGCESCFGCTNLRNKKYYFLNKKCESAEEWQQKVDELLQSKSRQELLEYFINFKRTQPTKWMTEIRTENCTGDYLIGCKDSLECYDSEDLEKCKYCYDIKRTRDNSPNFSNYDISHFGGALTECYECCSIGNAGVNRCMFCENIWASSEVLYSRTCNQSKNLFGCIGLRNASYCIFNKQYSKEDYEVLVPKIIAHMKSTGEWGEFFPTKYSPYGYNETLAQENFPITEEDAIRLGWKWKTEEQKKIPSSAVLVKDFIKDATDEHTLKQVFICEETGKPFRVTQQELNFYKKMDLPLPRFCFEARHMKRTRLKNPRYLVKKKCVACNTAIETTESSPNAKAHCQECYLKVVD